uniref:Casein kinase I n=1 Tax=Albugo laibachii Nc14 TaxID=890382 RepID=F0VZT6_9STRA|nr:casein kinase I putative [Albugo laibachii Nc14]|eukprot:CCA14307.1 casein kinase I putative [Albugo laibachii Nc14]
MKLLISTNRKVVDLMQHSLHEGIQLKSWILGKMVGSGACSEVYEVREEEKNAYDFVMKISPVDPPISLKKKKRKKTDRERNADALYAEQLLYRTYLNDHPGIPKLPDRACGEDKVGYRFLVMERLGRTLDDALRDDGIISHTTAARIAHELIDVFQYLHTKNILFVDVKPANFMLNRLKESRVYCVDFGISARYVTAAGKHKGYKIGAIVGTPTFLSLSCHEGATPSRRDDIEGLLYVTIYLMRGNLPWQNATSDQEGAQMKKSIPIKELCESLPKEWIELLQQSRSCGFEEKPDYDSYRKTLRKLAGEFKPGDPIVWNKSKGRAEGKSKPITQAISESASPPRKRATRRKVSVKQTKAMQSDAKKSVKEAKKDTSKGTKEKGEHKRTISTKKVVPDVKTASATSKSRTVTKRYSLRSNA